MGAYNLGLFPSCRTAPAGKKAQPSIKDQADLQPCSALETAHSWRRGEAAYVLDLADLATTDLRVLLSPNPERFDDWASQAASVATFFLDSYDELKMTRGKFEQALNRMASALSGNLHRARVVTTTAQSSAELLRLLGATVPAIDGPSADDRQFD